MDFDTVQRLRALYLSVDDLDLFTGGLSEKPVRGGIVGPTFACIIAQQFANIRKGDRFWYENGGYESSFTPAQLQQIRRVTLANVLCVTLDEIETIQPFAFLTAEETRNKRMACDDPSISGFKVGPWAERKSSSNRRHHIRANDDDYDDLMSERADAEESAPSRPSRPNRPNRPSRPSRPSRPNRRPLRRRTTTTTTTTTTPSPIISNFASPGFSQYVYSYQQSGSSPVRPPAHHFFIPYPQSQGEYEEYEEDYRYSSTPRYTSYSSNPQNDLVVVNLTDNFGLQHTPSPYKVNINIHILPGDKPSQPHSGISDYATSRPDYYPSATTVKIKPSVFPTRHTTFQDNPFATSSSKRPYTTTTRKPVIIPSYLYFTGDVNDHQEEAYGAYHTTTTSRPYPDQPSQLPDNALKKIYSLVMNTNFASKPSKIDLHFHHQLSHDPQAQWSSKLTPFKTVLSTSAPKRKSKPKHKTKKKRPTPLPSAYQDRDQNLFVKISSVQGEKLTTVEEMKRPIYINVQQREDEIELEEVVSESPIVQVDVIPSEVR